MVFVPMTARTKTKSKEITLPEQNQPILQRKESCSKATTADNSRSF